MGIMRRTIAALLLAILASTPASAADPFVTVSPARDGSTSLAWWLLDMESRPAAG